MRKLELWGLGLVVFLSVSAFADHSNPLGRSSLEGTTSRELPGMIAFHSTLAVPPAFNQERVSPMPGDDRSQLIAWADKMKEWDIWGAKSIEGIRSALSSATSNSILSREATEGLKNIRDGVRRAKKRVELSAGGDRELGTYVVSEPARALNQEIVAMATAFVQNIGEQPGKIEKYDAVRNAHRKVIEKFPRAKLNRFSASDLNKLSEHHRDEVRELTRLRDHLRENGNFEFFLSEFFNETRPVHRIEAGTTLIH